MSATPVSEQKNSIAECIALCRINLGTFAENFHHSAALFELLERGGNPTAGVFGGVFFHYRMIAARDGALNIYHFGCSLDAIRAWMPHSQRVDLNSIITALDNSIREFNEYFPYIDNIRHAIAHAGELNDTPGKIKGNTLLKSRRGHGVSTGPGGLFVQGLFERTYSIGKSGKIFTVTIDQTTLDKLKHIIFLVNTSLATP